MKKSLPVFRTALLAAGLILGITSCSKPQERYEDPPWLGGSNIETLEKRGDYKIFLELMDSAGYRDPITKTLFTLFVPNDEAFQTYFQEIGISSVAELTNEEARNLFTLHILRNPRSRFQLIYEYLWGELQGPEGEYASLFFRKRTLSTSVPYKEDTVRYNLLQKDKTPLMYTDKKLVPLFTKEYFGDFFGAPDGSDYEFMYPGTTWNKDIGMAWHSSQVIEVDVETPNGTVKQSEIPTASGFIFFIDKVVPPMKNIEEFLREHRGPGEYRLYYDMLQRFAVYTAPTKNKTTQELMYRKSYDGISDIAAEEGPFPGNETGMKDMFSAFIPNDVVFQEYLDNKVLKSYGSLDSVPEITLFYIIQTQLSRSLGLISKISNSYFNSFGDPMIISKEDIKSAQMCSNGVVYDMNRVLEPNVFTTVPGILFFDANYSTFLMAVTMAGMTASLSNANMDVTLFAPTNDVLEANGIRFNKEDLMIEFKGADSTWNGMDYLEMVIFVQDHIYSGVLSETELNGEGFAEMISGNFIHYSNGQISGALNEADDYYVEVETESVNEKNGILQQVTGPIKSNWVMGKYLKSDPDISTFTGLMKSTKLLTTKFDRKLQDSIVAISFYTQSLAWTAFIPDNAAMAEGFATGKVPPLDLKTDGTVNPDQSKNTALKEFLQYHFLKDATIFDTPTFDVGFLSGKFQTIRAYQDENANSTFSTLQIDNSLHNLTITDLKGKTVTVDHAGANNLVRLGVVHKINSVLNF